MPEPRRGLCLIVAVLLGAATPAWAQRMTLDSTARTVWAQLLAVHDARSADTTVIDRALASPIAPLRATAARVVGMNRIAVRYPVLHTMLQSDPDTAVAGDAAFALGLAGDSASCRALRNALAVSGTGVAAAWALGELGDRCGDLSPLLATARDSSARAALLRVAGKWTPFPDSVVVAAFRSAATPSERWGALYALGRARRPAGAALAIAVSTDASAALRELAARLMTSTIQPAADSLPVVARLQAMLHDRAPLVRIAVVRALASYRALARVPLAGAWSVERDVNVRVTMAQSIGTVAADTASIWRQWWEADTTHMVRRSLIASARQAGAIAALEGGASALATHPDFRLRVAMIEGAAAAGVDRHARQIASRLTDADGRVRAAVVTALSRLAQPMRDSLDWSAMLGAAERDEDAGVRTAVQRLRRRDDPSGGVQQPNTPVTAAASPEEYERIVRDVIIPSLAGRAPSLLLETGRGMVRIVLDGVRTPMTSDHLSRLARAGYFRDLRFHRVVPAFVAQGGDPRGDGTGGPGFAIRDELNRSPYVRGAVGMALSGPDTGGSQFFLTLASQPHLDGHYTVFGSVASGTVVMDALVQGDALRNITPATR